MCDHEDDDGLGCVRGLMLAVPVGIVMWALIIYAARAIF